MPRRNLDAGVAEAASTVAPLAAWLDELVKDPTSAAVHATALAVTKAPIERAMGAELSHHLCLRAGEPPPVAHWQKTELAEDGQVRIAAQWDRDGALELLPTPKHARRMAAAHAAGRLALRQC